MSLRKKEYGKGSSHDIVPEPGTEKEAFKENLIHFAEKLQPQIEQCALGASLAGRLSSGDYYNYSTR